MALVTRIGKCLVVEHRAIKREPVMLRLPYPLSVNNLFFNTKTGRVPTEKYKAWRAAAGNMIVQAGRPHISGPVEITMTFQDRGGNRDLDNLVKSICDICVEMRVIDGDHSAIVRKLSLAWGEHEGTVIRIVPAPPSARSAAA